MILKRLLIPIGFFVLLSCVYGFSSTVLPTGHADSDELITIANFNSVAHPPGFPLFIFVSHGLLKLLPFLPVAHAANLLAGVYQASATVIFGYLIRQILSHLVKKSSASFPINLATITATGLLAFSYQWWLYGTIFEIYSFTALLTGLTLLLAFRWYYQPKFSFNAYFWATWIMAGLLVGHFQLALLLLPGLCLMLLQKQLRFPQKTSTLFLAAGRGILLFIITFFLSNSLLFFQNQHGQTFSWGMIQTFTGWLNHLTRKDYTGFNLEQNTDYQTSFVLPTTFDATTIKSVVQYIQMLFTYYGLVGMLFFLIGLFYIWKKDRPLALILTTYFFCTSIFLAGYMRLSSLSFQSTLFTGVGERQFSMGMGIVAIGIAFGIFALYEYIFLKLNRRKTLIVVLISLLLISVQISENKSVFTRRSSRTIAYAVAKERLEAVPTNSLIICSTDVDCYSLFYQHSIEHVRPDVLVLPHIVAYKFLQITQDTALYPYLNFTQPDYLAQLISWNVHQRPVYLTSGMNYYADYIGLESGPFFLAPVHQLFKVSTILPATMAAEPIPAYISSTPMDTKNKHAQGIVNVFANNDAYAAYIALRYQFPEVAQSYLSNALTLDPSNRQTHQLNLQQTQVANSMKVIQDKITVADYEKAAGAAEKLQQLDQAERLYRQATYLDPTHISALTKLRDFYIKYGASEPAQIIDQHIGIMSSVKPM